MVATRFSCHNSGIFPCLPIQQLSFVRSVISPVSHTYNNCETFLSISIKILQICLPHIPNSTYSFSYLFHIGTQLPQFWDFLLIIVWPFCNNMYQYSLWTYIVSISKTIFSYNFSYLQTTKKKLVSHTSYTNNCSEIQLKIVHFNNKFTSHMIWNGGILPHICIISTYQNFHNAIKLGMQLNQCANVHGLIYTPFILVLVSYYLIFMSGTSPW